MKVLWKRRGGSTIFNLSLTKWGDPVGPWGPLEPDARVPIDSIFVVDFTSPLDEASITPETMQFLQSNKYADPDVVVVPYTVEISPDKKTVSLTPNSNLLMGYQTTIIFTTDIKSEGGTPLPEQLFANCWTVGDELSLISTSPINESIGDPDEPIVMYFSAPVDSIEGGLFVSYMNGGVRTTITGDLFFDHAIITFTPTNPLPDALITVNLESDMIIGRFNERLVEDTFFTFNVGELMDVTGTVPEINATDVDKDTTIEVTFSADIDEVTVTAESFIVTYAG